MKKNIKSHIKLISSLTCICVIIMQTCLGCDASYSLPKDSRLHIHSDFTNYIAENFDKYQSRIKEESGFQGKITSEEKDGKEQKYIEFDIDDTTKIKFEADDVGVIITKQIEKYNGTNFKREIEIFLIGMEEDDNVSISLNGNGSISCDYKANDLENPLPSQKEKDEGIDSQIKIATSTKELEDLTSKAHLIYNVFEEICNEYNESLKK